jgi:hypothetical protein
MYNEKKGLLNNVFDTTCCTGVLHQDGFPLRERVIAVYARRGAQNAESLLEYSNTF